MSLAEAGVVTLYYAILGVLAIYGTHRWHLVRFLRRSPPKSTHR
jgi:hypothetical protein